MFKRFRCKVPMNLQKFCRRRIWRWWGAGGSAANGGTPPAGVQQTPQFDYDKLAKSDRRKTDCNRRICSERLLLKQQGLSKEQMDQAIASFKQQQAAKSAGCCRNAESDHRGTGTACSISESCSGSTGRECSYNDGCSWESKQRQFHISSKWQNLSQVMGEDGNINEESLKTAVNKVLEDVPALKTADGW